MFLILKRFPMDDVPIGLYKTMDEAVFYVDSDWGNSADEIDVFTGKTGNYATGEQQDLMQCDIGCEFCGTYLIVEFDDRGQTVNSQIINFKV